MVAEKADEVFLYENPVQEEDAPEQIIEEQEAHQDESHDGKKDFQHAQTYKSMGYLTTAASTYKKGNGYLQT